MTVIGCLAALALCAPLAATAEEQSVMAKKDDYSWVRGANYIPSYAATDVEIWNNFDPEVVDRELGYAERLELNSIRVFLQYHVYEMYPEKFLKNVKTFVDLCEKHKIRPMLILFDSCFGVSPSLNSGELWVASPGPDRTNPDFYPQGEKYVRALVEMFRDDPRVLFWDVMNEPNATPLAMTDEGKKLIWDFVRHFCDFVHSIDKTHAVTVGIAGNDNSEVVDHVDVLSMHSYNKDADGFRADIQKTRTQAQAASKPFIITECCAPGWNNHYEMVMPILREEKIGYYIWEVIIARTQFAHISGLCYPDGTVRSLSAIEAVLDRPPEGFVEKPGSEGKPIGAGPGLKEMLTPTFERMTKNPTNAENWSERTTFLSIMTIREDSALGKRKDEIAKPLDAAKTLRKSGNDAEAFAAVDALLKLASDAFFSKE